MFGDHSLNNSHTPKTVGLARLSYKSLGSEFVVGFVHYSFTKESTYPSAGNPSPAAISAEGPDIQLLSFHFQAILQTSNKNKMVINGLRRIN